MTKFLVAHCRMNWCALCMVSFWVMIIVGCAGNDSEQTSRPSPQSPQRVDAISAKVDEGNADEARSEEIVGSGPVHITNGSALTSHEIQIPFDLEQEALRVEALAGVAQFPVRLPPGVTFTPYVPKSVDQRLWRSIEQSSKEVEQSPDVDSQTRAALKAERESLTKELEKLKGRLNELGRLWNSLDLRSRTVGFANEYWKIKDLADKWQQKVELAKQKCNRTVPPEEYEQLLKECKELERNLNTERGEILARDKRNIAYFNVVIADSERFGKEETGYLHGVDTWQKRIKAHGAAVIRARKKGRWNYVNIHVQKTGESGGGTRICEKDARNVARPQAIAMTDAVKVCIKGRFRAPEQTGLEKAIMGIKRFLNTHSQPEGGWQTFQKLFGPDRKWRIDVEIQGIYPYPGDV